jgi:hypothetical protein
MTEPQRQVLVQTYFELEAVMQEYRKTLLWLTHGNHKDTPRPTVHATRQLIKEHREKITTLLAEIESAIS